MKWFKSKDDSRALSEKSGHFLVVDVETTGLHNSDRVVEVATVTLSRDGETLDEWDTLVNPSRDVGPTHIHGVTASMVSVAPRFEEVAVALAGRIEGLILVGHNLAFDTRMLVNEYAKLGSKLDPGVGVCTMAGTGMRLEDACACHGIELEQHHRALADARATGRRLCVAGCRRGDAQPARLEGLSVSAMPRTLRRDVIPGHPSQMPYLARLAARSHHRGQRGPALLYLDMLDRALDDLVLTAEEWAELNALAASLGLDGDEVMAAHESYLHELIIAAARDKVITDEEYGLLERVAIALNLDRRTLAEAVAPYMRSAEFTRLETGMTVCFTGVVTYADGAELPRESLARIAQTLNLRVVDSVTKKGCDILVAGDPSSLSGKAGKARQYGIPIVDARDFLCADVGGAVRAR